MDRPIKSVHLTNYYHKNSGGISTSYDNLLAAAGRHKRHIRLIVPGETEAIEDRNEFARVYYIPAKYSPIFDKRYRLIMPWQYMKNDSLIRKILLEEMPDIVEVTDKYTLSMLGGMIRIGKFHELGRPMLVHFSCERMDDNISSFLTKGKIGSWIARRVMGNYNFPSFDYHIANSAYTAEELHEAVSRANNPGRSDRFLNKWWRFLSAPRVGVAERIFVCPRGVNVERYQPDRKSNDVKAKMRKRAHIPEDSTVLLYAGRISPEKNIPLLIDVMKLLASDTEHDFRLLIAGAGPQAEWLKEQGEKWAPEKIVLLGHLDKETLADFYANADVFVHPNPREPFGIAPLEAMAAGVPTVAPNYGGILSYADNSNAWLVEPNGESFAAAIREVVNDPELAARKTEKALETARTNTWEHSTDNLLATYDKLFEDFQRRLELFTDTDAARKFNYLELINSTNA